MQKHVELLRIQCERETSHHVTLAAPQLGQIGQTVQRLKADRDIALLIAPQWTAQPWFQTLQQGTRKQWYLGTPTTLWQREPHELQYPEWSISAFLVDFRSP
jgi:hypothetical protein